MTQLHELLAVEKTRTADAQKIMAETAKKFNDQVLFKGSSRTLTMIGDVQANPALKAEQDAGCSNAAVATTVLDTLEYALGLWATAEDVIFQKNLTNCKASADIVVGETVVANDVPVDELLGLEVRLDQIRNLLASMPTLDAKRVWKTDPTLPDGIWVTGETHSTKTKKELRPVILFAGDEHHPPQIEKVTEEVIVGQYTDKQFSGAATAKQMADCLTAVTNLIAAVKEARMRANTAPVVNQKIGKVIAEVILQSLRTK